MEDFKVLLVDDEEDFVKTLSERLQMRDLDTGLAFDGKQALQTVQDEMPSVMVLDLKMPGMDGMEVLRQVKKAYPRVEVIILTGHGTDKDEEQALRLGAFAYLRKPVELDRLVDTMKKAYQKFKQYQDRTDDALMAATLAQAGGMDMAREIMSKGKKKKGKKG